MIIQVYEFNIGPLIAMSSPSILIMILILSSVTFQTFHFEAAAESSDQAQELLPDLTVIGVWLDPYTPKPGDNVTFWMRMANAGTAVAYHCPIECYLDDRLFAVLIRLGGLSPSSFEDSRIDAVWNATEGYHRFDITVDPIDAIRESNETNNKMGIEFHVTRDVYPIKVDVRDLEAEYCTDVKIDDRVFGTIDGGGSRSFTFEVGTAHRISVNPYVLIEADRIRYSCPSNSWSFSSEGSHVFHYILQYFLRIQTDPPKISTSGTGWYDENTIATITGPPLININPKTRYVFSYWLIRDFTETRVLDNPSDIVVYFALDVTAKYKIQHYLTVNSTYGSPTGSGWYDSGSTANISISSPIPVSDFMSFLGAKYVFEYWTCDSKIVSLKPSATIPIDGPKTILAVWKTDCTQVYIVVVPTAVIVIVLACLATSLRKMKKGRGAIGSIRPSLLQIDRISAEGMAHST